MDHDYRENLVSPETTILDTLKIIDSHGVPIGLVHADGRLIGTVTDGDIRRGLLAGVALTEAVTEVMNVDPVTAAADIIEADAAALMRRHGINQLPLVDADGKIVGLKVLQRLDRERSANSAVVIMAGGRGQRLRPLTEDLPKPMLEVGGRPILETIVERFVEQGFRRIHISVNYKADLIESHFGDGRDFGAEISYLRETSALGTAGALSLLEGHPSAPLIVTNGDVLNKVNFTHLLRFHMDHGGPATMSVREYRFTVPFGVVETDAHRLVGVEEKPEHTFFVNAGIYALDADVLELIPAGKAMDMPDLFKMLMDKGKTPSVFPLREYWLDIGRLDDLDQAKRDYAGLFPGTSGS